MLYVLFGLATLACGLAPTYGSLMAARIAAGIFGGVMSALSQTIVGDVIPFERRGRAMGIVMTSFSVSTVAGVPLGLFIAAHLGWHASFIGIALLCAVFAVFAALTLPALTAHLHVKDRPSTFAGIAGVLADRNHQKAFVFTALTMFAAFTIIPYITIYMQANAGLRADQVPWVYLCGGAGTLVSARLLGRMTDSRGKVPTYRMLGIGMLVPLFAMTLIHNVPVWVILAVSTLFFMSSSGRMIPGMAIVTSAANPRLRGTFMTLNASVQSAAMGLAAFVGGLIISRDANGLVQDYWVAAAAGACQPAGGLDGRQIDPAWRSGCRRHAGSRRKKLSLFKHLQPASERVAICCKTVSEKGLLFAVAARIVKSSRTINHLHPTPHRTRYRIPLHPFSRLPFPCGAAVSHPVSTGGYT